MSQHVHLHPVLSRLTYVMLLVSLLLAIVVLAFPLKAQAAPVQPLLWCECLCEEVGQPWCRFLVCHQYCCNPSTSDCFAGYGWYCLSPGWHCHPTCPC